MTGLQELLSAFVNGLLGLLLSLRTGIFDWLQGLFG